MSDLELSIMAHSPTTEPDLQPILAKFEVQHRVKVKVRVFSWESGWTELMKFALYGHGPDVSEIESSVGRHPGRHECLASLRPA